MKFLVHSLNYLPERVGVAVYSGGLATWLAAHGHEVNVVSGPPYYPAWAVDPAYRYGWHSSVENGVGVVRCPIYVPARPTGPRRILHHITFGLSSLLPLLVSAAKHRPDVVFVAAPSLIAAPAALLAARLFGAKAWLHIQDFEVEAAFSTGLLNANGLFANLALWFEKRVMTAFDVVSSISPNMCRRLELKGVELDRIVEFRNWADLRTVAPLSGPSPYRAEWNIGTKFVALYSGNIANKQGIEILVDVARRLGDRDDLTIVICGDGPNKPQLMELAAGLPNVVFQDLQPRERLGELMSLATVHLLPQLAGAADLVLPSKLTNMLASGRPVIAAAAAGTALATEVSHGGIAVEPGSAEAFAQALETLLNDDDLRARLGDAARERALEAWDPERILERFAGVAASLVEPAAGETSRSGTTAG